MSSPPVPYFGGKQRIASKIANLLPSHQHYVEPFGGGLSVLFAKRPAPMETVSDIDGHIMAFWRVLRDRPADLARACALTPHARTEHAAAADLNVDDDLEHARRVWIRLTQGRGGQLRKTGWRYHVDPSGSTMSMSAYLRGYVQRIIPAAERLQRVSLECKPALDLIAQYGQHPGVLLYLDPPYLGSTRAGSTDGYRVEMIRPDQHAALLASIVDLPCAVVLSGYSSEQYDDALSKWSRIEIDASTGQGSVWSKRTEVLWSNREINTPSLFDVGGESA